MLLVHCSWTRLWGAFLSECWMIRGAEIGNSVQILLHIHWKDIRISDDSLRFITCCTQEHFSRKGPRHADQHGNRFLRGSNSFRAILGITIDLMRSFDIYCGRTRCKRTICAIRIVLYELLHHWLKQMLPLGYAPLANNAHWKQFKDEALIFGWQNAPHLNLRC